MNPGIKGVGIGLIVVALGGVLAGCDRGRAHSGGAAPGQMPAPVVTVAPVQPQEIVEWSEFTGRTVAIENVEVRPRVSGHIEAVKFQSGQLVKKGEVLFQIDSRWYQAF